jgi:hypothetical protein
MLKEGVIMKQALLTVSAGKRLIGKALARHPEIKKTLIQGTLVVVAGTTNGYAAEEIFETIGETRTFKRQRFIRGITLPPGHTISVQGRLRDESGFPGDAVIQNGVWLPGKTINDVASALKEGDIILKGANALDLLHKRAAILIGNPNGGTIMPALQSFIGRRVRLIIPIGLEKRIPGDLDELADRINAPGITGLRLLPVPGEVFTEIEALYLLVGVKAEIFASGGVGGAEGCVRLIVNGTPEQEETAEKIIQSVSTEPAFTLE